MGSTRLKRTRELIMVMTTSQMTAATPASMPFMAMLTKMLSRKAA